MSNDQNPSGRVIYLDHAATTYLDPEVHAAMEPYWETEFGNPSSLYSIGRKSGTAIATARASVALLLNAKPAEIIFTAGGTESINLAIFGIAGTYDAHKTPYHLITSAIEHPAVLNCYKQLKRNGYETTILPVNQEGFVDLESIKAAIRPETILISIMYANNEIGTVEPIAEIAAWLKELNAQRAQQQLPTILFHTDACQAGGCLDIDVQHLGVDLMTLNGSKLYGPKQTGLLFFKEGLTLQPLIFGGGQERNLRSGTENVPGIMGFAKALEIAQQRRLPENKRLRELRNTLAQRILSEILDSRLNGPDVTTDSEEHPTRLPNNINVSFRGLEGESLLLTLDRIGVCVSTGSACASKEHEASHVLQAIHCPEEYSTGSIRVTLGKRNTLPDLDYAFDCMQTTITELRQASAITIDLKKITGSSDGARCVIMH